METQAEEELGLVCGREVRHDSQGARQLRFPSFTPEGPHVPGTDHALCGGGIGDILAQEWTKVQKLAEGEKKVCLVSLLPGGMDGSRGPRTGVLYPGVSRNSPAGMAVSCGDDLLGWGKKWNS